MGNINGFELPGGLLERKGVDATQSVSTSIVRLDSISVPAGTFKSNDVFLMQSLITRAVTTTVGMTHYIYWNTTDTTSGAVLLAVSQGSTLDEYIPLYRTVCVVNSTTTLVYNTSLTNSTDLGDTLGADLGSAISTITSINWDTDGFLIVAALITSSTLTLTKRYFTVLR